MRLSLKLVLLFEAAACLVFFGIAHLSSPPHPELLYMAGIFIVAIPLHAVLLLFKPAGFVMFDEPPDSIFKYYWFFTILASSFLGGFVAGALFAGTSS